MARGVLTRIRQLRKGMESETVCRQRIKDEEYVAACRASGIAPEPPSYRSYCGSGLMDEATASLIEKRGSPLDTPCPSDRNFPPEFAFDEGLDEGLDDEAVEHPAATPDAAELLLRILTELSTGHRDSASAVANKVLVLSWLLHVPGFGDLTQTELARRMGCTKALVSHYAVQLGKKFGIHDRRMKSKLSSENYRRAREGAIASGMASTRSPDWIEGWQDAREKSEAEN